MQLFFTPITASVLTFIYISLAFKVIRHRRSARIGIGASGDIELSRKIRAHGNFSEYVPLCLILLLAAELQQASTIPLALASVAIIMGRFIHSTGISREPENLRLRVTGMVLTFLSLATLAITNVLVAL